MAKTTVLKVTIMRMWGDREATIIAINSHTIPCAISVAISMRVGSLRDSPADVRRYSSKEPFFINSVMIKMGSPIVHTA